MPMLGKYLTIYLHLFIWSDRIILTYSTTNNKIRICAGFSSLSNYATSKIHVSFMPHTSSPTDNCGLTFTGTVDVLCNIVFTWRPVCLIDSFNKLARQVILKFATRVCLYIAFGFSLSDTAVCATT